MGVYELFLVYASRTKIWNDSKRHLRKLYARLIPIWNQYACRIRIFPELQSFRSVNESAKLKLRYVQPYDCRRGFLP